MSNGDKPVERCGNCGQLNEIHTGLQRRCGGIYSSCWSPQPGVTEGPYQEPIKKANGDWWFYAPFDEVGPFESKEFAEISRKNENTIWWNAFAQGASSVRQVTVNLDTEVSKLLLAKFVAEVDKLKAENERLLEALELIDEKYEKLDLLEMGELQIIAQQALSAHRDSGNGVCEVCGVPFAWHNWKGESHEFKEKL